MSDFQTDSMKTFRKYSSFKKIREFKRFQLTNISNIFGLPDGQCQQCQTLTKKKNELIFDIDSNDVSKAKSVSMKQIMKLLINKLSENSCCSENIRWHTKKDRIIIIRFSYPVNLNLSSTESFGSQQLLYLSHLQESGDNLYLSYFKIRNKLVYQNLDGAVCMDRFGNHGNVVMLCVRISFSAIQEELPTN